MGRNVFLILCRTGQSEKAYRKAIELAPTNLLARQVIFIFFIGSHLLAQIFLNPMAGPCGVVLDGLRLAEDARRSQ